MDMDLILTGGTLLLSGVNTVLLLSRPTDRPTDPVAVAAAVLAAPLAPRVPAPIMLPETPGDPAPPWGTVERKEWHRQQRNFHAQMTVEAGKAVK